MSAPNPFPPDDDAARAPEKARLSRLARRRQRIAEEIARNRRGEYKVPTWVLVLALALLVGGWLALVLLS